MLNMCFHIRCSAVIPIHMRERRKHAPMCSKTRFTATRSLCVMALLFSSQQHCVCTCDVATASRTMFAEDSGAKKHYSATNNVRTASSAASGISINLEPSVMSRYVTVSAAHGMAWRGRLGTSAAAPHDTTRTKAALGSLAAPAGQAPHRRTPSPPALLHSVVGSSCLASDPSRGCTLTRWSASACPRDRAGRAKSAQTR